MKPLPYVVSMVLSLTVCGINAKPQHLQESQSANPAVQRATDETFSTRATSTTTPRTKVYADNQQCKCVPYYVCNDTVRGVDEEGFGHIDIGINPNNCPNVLGMCCDVAKLREEPIMPVMPANVSTRAAGCGIRNVGGLDFQIVGALVSLSI